MYVYQAVQASPAIVQSFCEKQINHMCHLGYFTPSVEQRKSPVNCRYHASLRALQAILSALPYSTFFKSLLYQHLSIEELILWVCLFLALSFDGASCFLLIPSSWRQDPSLRGLGCAERNIMRCAHRGTNLCTIYLHGQSYLNSVFNLESIIWLRNTLVEQKPSFPLSHPCSALLPSYAVFWFGLVCVLPSKTPVTSLLLHLPQTLTK